MTIEDFFESVYFIFKIEMSVFQKRLLLLFYAFHKFQISLHPTMLTGYIKSNIASGDTAIIHIDLYSSNNVVDNGNLFETNSHLNYIKIEIQSHSIIKSREGHLIATKIRCLNKYFSTVQ